jgi:hypothetical protein
MQAITYHSSYKSLSAQRSHNNILSRLMAWIISEEKNRIAWVGISITAMSAIFFPFTMAAILFNGAVFPLIIGAMISLAIVVITNLAALPTKYTIPAFLLGILIDLVLIIVSFVFR